jgi:hypothetical protein
MGVVSALRETSVVYAAIIGRVFLKETRTKRRRASCAAVASGAHLWPTDELQAPERHD